MKQNKKDMTSQLYTIYEYEKYSNACQCESYGGERIKYHFLKLKIELVCQ